MKIEKAKKLSPQEWGMFFEAAEVRLESLKECKSRRARTIKMGQFLSPNVDREVAIEVNGRTGKAILRVEKGRAKEKRYYFEVVWDAPAQSEQTKPKKTRNTKKTTRKSGEGEPVKPLPQRKSSQAEQESAGNTEKWG